MLRNHSVGFADTSRRFHRHFSRLHSAALLKCFVPFRRLCRHFSQASPALLDGLRPSLPAASFRRTSQMFFAFSSALPTLPAGSACKLSPLLARAKISSLSSPSVRLPPAEPANSPSTFGSREFLSSVLLLR